LEKATRLSQIGRDATPVLSRSVCDAARALGYLGRAGSAVVVEEVSRGTGLFRPSLAKLMGTLVRKGFVTTRRGVGGGVALTRRPGSITLFDLCVALDDPVLVARCLLGGGHEDGGAACPASDLERRHHRETLAFLRRTSVVEVAAAFPELRNPKWAARA
jgi:Rrf2 family protein